MQICVIHLWTLFSLIFLFHKIYIFKAIESCRIAQWVSAFRVMLDISYLPMPIPRGGVIQSKYPLPPEVSSSLGGSMKQVIRRDSQYVPATLPPA